MATTNTPTIKDVLTIAAAIPADVWEQYAEGKGEAVAAKFKLMLENENKKRENARKAPKTKSKEQREREERATKAAELIAAHGEPVTSEWVLAHVDGLMSVNAANGCMTTAQRLGLIVKCGSVRANGSSRVLYGTPDMKPVEETEE